MQANDFLTPAQLAERWGGAVTVGTLANWRANSKGPKFTKFGSRVRYRLSDVLAYEEQQTQGSIGAAGE